MDGMKIVCDGSSWRVELYDPLYLSLQEQIGGYWEIVRPRNLPKPYCMIVDEEGMLKGLPINFVGSYLYDSHNHGTPIVGNIIILREEDTPEGRDLIGLNGRDFEILSQIIAPAY